MGRVVVTVLIEGGELWLLINSGEHTAKVKDVRKRHGGSCVENVFDQPVNRGSAAAWPVVAGRIVAMSSAADGVINHVAGDLACTDPLIIIWKVPFQPVDAILWRFDTGAVFEMKQQPVFKLWVA